MTKTPDVEETHDEEPLSPATEVLDEKPLLDTGLSPDEVVMGRRPGPHDQGPGLAFARYRWVVEAVDQDGPGDRPGTELPQHLGYDTHDPSGPNLGNSRNGYRSNPVVW